MTIYPPIPPAQSNAARTALTTSQLPPYEVSAHQAHVRFYHSSEQKRPWSAAAQKSRRTQNKLGGDAGFVNGISAFHSLAGGDPFGRLYQTFHVIPTIHNHWVHEELSFSLTHKWTPKALIKVYNKPINAKRKINTSAGALAHVGAPRQCARDATAPLSLSWFGSLPDTAKDSTSCCGGCLAIFGHSYFFWWQRLPSTEPEGSGCIPGPLAVGTSPMHTAPVGRDTSCPITASL